MSNDMVERVAEAIYDHANTQGEEPFTEVSAETREWFRRHARAAIEAMREPTGQMVAAYFGAGTCADAWRASVDAALV